MQNQRPMWRKIVSMILVIAFVLTTSLSSSSAIETVKPENNTAKVEAVNVNPTQIVGQLTVYGSVTLNDKKAINGTSVFTESRIKVACAKGNLAIVNLGPLGRVELNPGTEMVLRYGENLVSGDLVEGNILVNSPKGVKVSINTTEGVTSSDGVDSTIIPVRTQRGVRCVPLVMSSSSSSSVLNSAAIAAILLGVGGVAVAGAVVTTDTGSFVSPNN